MLKGKFYQGQELKSGNIDNLQREGIQLKEKASRQMWNTNSSTAAEQLAAARKRFKQALKEKEKIWQQKAECTAKLRSARLTKEAQERVPLIKPVQSERS